MIQFLRYDHIFKTNIETDAKKGIYRPRNRLLLENPQFSSDFFEILSKCPTHEWVILTKSRKN